jgi:hypothetical protein
MYSEVAEEPDASVIRVTELGQCESVTWTLLIALQDVVTQNKEVCQYSIIESPEVGFRIRM